MGYDDDKEKADKHMMYGVWALCIIPPLIGISGKLLFQ